MKSQSAPENYDFPVELQPLHTIDNKIIPGFKGVRRTDTGRVLSVVTPRYHLVEHKRVLEGAERFIEAIGAEPERKYHVSKHGALFTAELIYKDKTAAVNVGDKVGLRVFLMSSYTGAHLNRVKIGGLVLSCKNGMVSPNKTFNHVFRHVGSNNMAFPDVNEVLSKFYTEAEAWRRYASIEAKNMPQLVQLLRETKILPSSGVDYVEKHGQPAVTMWDFLQKCTYFVTHLNARISPLGKMDRLEKLATWFKQHFGS